MTMRRLPLALILLFAAWPAAAEPLPGTKPLTADGDLAAQMVSGIDAYLMREIAASVEKRQQFWNPAFAFVPAPTRPAGRH